MTYDPENDSTDAVRFLIGDIDATSSDDPVLSDAEINFALTTVNNDTFRAAALCCRALAARYATLVDTRFESIDERFSQRQKAYLDLAKRLDAQAKIFGSGGLGFPIAGGISEGDMETVRADTDRVKPAFTMRMFENPPVDAEE